MRYYYRPITRASTQFWRCSGRGISLAHATAKPELRLFYSPWRKTVANHTKTPRRWQFFRHISRTDLTLRVTVSPRCPSPSQDSTRHASTFYRAGGGVCRAAITARASDNKKNNLTSRRRAANSQPYQPLPVVGLMRASTGTPDTLRLMCPSFAVALLLAEEAVDLSASISNKMNRFAVATCWPP